jgi:hypothetical protein
MYAVASAGSYAPINFKTYRILALVYKIRNALPLIEMQYSETSHSPVDQILSHISSRICISTPADVGGCAKSSRGVYSVRLREGGSGMLMVERVWIAGSL